MFNFNVLNLVQFGLSQMSFYLLGNLPLASLAQPFRVSLLWYLPQHVTANLLRLGASLPVHSDQALPQPP